MWDPSFGGHSHMPAIAAGTTAPDFSLPVLEGKTFNLKEALAQGPVVLAFFKVSCPTCQYALPFLERIFKAHGNGNVTFAGVSQNKPRDTAAFLKQYGVSFPVLLDDIDSYPVSNAYGLTNVPTIFWIAPDGEVEVSSVGWVKQDIDEINRRAARAVGQDTIPVFHSGEQVLDFRAG